MWLLSIVGIIISVSALLLAHAVGGGSLLTLLQPTAFLIVGGATMGAVLLQSSPANVKFALSRLSLLFSVPGESQMSIVRSITEYARLAHKNGMLSLEPAANSIEDPLMRKGMQMIVDRIDPEHVRNTLRIELQVRDQQYKNAAKFWESAAGYAPTAGIMGSVMGLVHIMESLQDTAALGQGVAMCFVATLYGLCLANMFCLPVAHKIRSVAGDLLLREEMWVEGLYLIAKGTNPRLVEAQLFSFMPKVEPGQQTYAQGASL